MGKNEAQEKKTSNTEQPITELRPFYFPDYDLSVMAKDHESAMKELEERLSSLNDIKASKEANGDQK